MHESLKVYLKDSFVGWLSHETVGGEMRFSAITRANFSRMANDCGVSPKLVLSRLDALCGRITTAAERLAEECIALWSSGVYGKVLETVRAHVVQVSP